MRFEIRVRRSGVLLLGGIVLAAALAAAPTLIVGSILSLTATTENVSGAADGIRINVLRWSTDAERDQLVSAWTLAGAPAAGGRGGGRGAGRGRGGAPAQPGDAASAARGGGGTAAAAAGGGGGRGGRGRGRGGAAAVRLTPESSLAAALGKAPTVGYLWSSAEVAGYSLRYAVRQAEQDGGERIFLITDRRLGTWNDRWKPLGPEAPTNYDFSVIELHLNSKGKGEGKLSLTGKMAVDSTAKIISLEDYDALPVVLKDAVETVGSK